jgi:hypothetical protein
MYFGTAQTSSWCLAAPLPQNSRTTASVSILRHPQSAPTLHCFPCPRFRSCAQATICSKRAGSPGWSAKRSACVYERPIPTELGQENREGVDHIVVELLPSFERCSQEAYGPSRPIRSQYIVGPTDAGTLVNPYLSSRVESLSRP